MLSYDKVKLVITEQRADLLVRSFSRVISNSSAEQVPIEAVIKLINDTPEVEQPFAEAEVSQIIKNEGDAVYDADREKWVLAGDVFERCGLQC